MLAIHRAVTMGRKGKKNKHTAKELQRKIDAHKDKGGGSKGLARRRQGHASVMCKMCRKNVPSMKSLQEHFDRWVVGSFGRSLPGQLCTQDS